MKSHRPAQELDGTIDGDQYFLSPRIQTLKAIRAKIRPNRCASVAVAEQYALPRATLHRDAIGDAEPIGKHA
jgi:hypothetical protein